MVHLGGGHLDALGTSLVVSAAPHDKAGAAGAAIETTAGLGTGFARTLPSELPNEDCHRSRRVDLRSHGRPHRAGRGAGLTARKFAGVASASGMQAATWTQERAFSG
ncbi:hypothetical protein GCM10027590_28000 [Nocardiopsis nanhaiensis]